MGNWKANLNLAQVQTFVQGWAEKTAAASLPAEVQVAIGVPSIFYVYLQQQKVDFSVALQDISIFGENGAHTGEVTVENLAGIYPQFTIVGHSERRAEFSESNEVVAHKVKNLVRVGVTPVVCVDLDQIQEMAKLLKDVPADKYIVAYEPLEAIGSGKNLSGELLKESFKLLHQVFAPETPLLYGGSVKPENAAEYGAVADGVLVGGASMEVEKFWQIAQKF